VYSYSVLRGCSSILISASTPSLSSRGELVAVLLLSAMCDDPAAYLGAALELYVGVR